MTRARITCSAPGLHEEGTEVRAAVERVLGSGWFILGPEVERFEAAFARASGAAYAVGVGNGTDALSLILRALDIGPGDEVITSPLSAAYSALAITMVGARPVFADIDPQRLTINPAAVEAAVTSRTRAIMPVHLYGQAADLPALSAIAERHHVALVEDCCQAHLATSGGVPVGRWGVAGAFSFYPTKNLGALGDGGAVVTTDRALAATVKQLRNGGQTERYHHALAGINSRLDELQAAILSVRLTHLLAWTARRRMIASQYRAALPAHPALRLPPELDAGHVYHLMVGLTARRGAFQQHLASHGIETLVHYPVPIPRQPAFAGQHPAACPVADRICDQLVSLPMHPALSDADVADVCEAVWSFEKE